MLTKSEMQTILMWFHVTQSEIGLESDDWALAARLAQAVGATNYAADLLKRAEEEAFSTQ